MKWYTCIIHIPLHISPVQLFHTRAYTRKEAETRALLWARADAPTRGKRIEIEVRFVFEGKHDDSETKVRIISH